MTGSPDTAPPGPAKSNRRLWRLLPLPLILLGLAGWGGYTAYRSSLLASFEPACHKALEDKQWKKLDQVASSWAAWQPENADPWIFWAEAQQQQGNVDEAARILKSLPDEHPRTIPALVERTTLLFGTLNRPNEGVETCDRILRLNPQTCEARQRMIFFYALTLQRKQMVQAIHEAIERDCDLPEHYIYLLGTDWITFSNGYELNNRWLTQDPENETFLAARAMHFVSSAGLDESPSIQETGREPTSADATDATDAGGKPPARPNVPEHERILREYLERFPQNLELLAYFLNQATIEGDLAEVSELLSRAPPEALDDNRFWRFKGWLHARQDELPQAEQAFREALRLNPFDWVSQHQCADALRRQQKFDEVERMERLSTTGKELRKEILELPDARSVPQPLLERMADYCEACGETEVASRIRRRVDGIRLLQ